MYALPVLNTSPSSVTFCKYFSQLGTCLFIFLTASSDEPMFVTLMKSTASVFSSMVAFCAVLGIFAYVFDFPHISRIKWFASPLSSLKATSEQHTPGFSPHHHPKDLLPTRTRQPSAPSRACNASRAGSGHPQVISLELPLA